jgi:hypothetical protein
VNYLKKEQIARKSFNITNSCNAEKEKLVVGCQSANHEFDLYEKGKVIGGISTSPLKNKSGTNNTGGQDRAAAELLWLSLWNGKEQRVLILTNKEMAKKTYKKFQGTPLRKKEIIMHFNLTTKVFDPIGTVG